MQRVRLTEQITRSTQLKLLNAAGANAPFSRIMGAVSLPLAVVAECLVRWPLVTTTSGPMRLAPSVNVTAEIKISQRCVIGICSIPSSAISMKVSRSAESEN